MGNVQTWELIERAKGQTCQCWPTCRTKPVDQWCYPFMLKVAGLRLGYLVGVSKMGNPNGQETSMDTLMPAEGSQADAALVEPVLD